MSTLAFLDAGCTECNDDGSRKIAFVGHAQRQVHDAATGGEGCCLAMKDERAVPRSAPAHLDRAPIGPLMFGLERFDGGLLRREARREPRGGHRCGRSQAVRRLATREDPLDVALGESVQRG
jgi:hypothetical protein